LRHHFGRNDKNSCLESRKVEDLMVAEIYFSER
jgi:hypothetical protein